MMSHVTERNALTSSDVRHKSECGIWFLILVTVCSVGVMSCRQETPKVHSGRFTVTFLDTLSFTTHIIVCLESDDSCEFVLLSQKRNIDNNSGTFTELRVGGSHQLTLKMFDSPPKLHFFIRRAGVSYYLHFESLLDGLDTNKVVLGDLDSTNLLWQDGQYRKKVFYSDEIYDRYIRNEN